jgi:PAS domain S-box-containing protein
MSDILSRSQDAASHIPQEFLDELPLPYLEIDCNGFVTRANRATRELHPPERGNLIGNMAWELLPADEIAGSFAAYCGLLESGGIPEPVHRSVYDNSGHYRTYEFHRSLILDANGKPAGMRMLAVNINESKKALEESHHSLLWLRSVIASIPEAIIITDAFGFIRDINPAAELLLGWNSVELIGHLVDKSISLEMSTTSDAALPTFNQMLESSSRCDITALDQHSNPLHLEVSASPITDTVNGHICGVVFVLRKL